MPEKSHVILPICRINRLDLDDVFNNLASKKCGGVIAPAPVPKSIDLSNIAGQLPKIGSDLYKNWLLVRRGTSPCPRPVDIPSALWDLIIEDSKFLTDLVRKWGTVNRTNESVHLIREGTIALDYHVDPVKEDLVRSYRLLQGEGMQIYSPTGPREIRGANVDSLATDSYPLSVVIANDTDAEIITVQPGEMVFFTSHMAHRSPLRPGPNSIRYTLG